MTMKSIKFIKTPGVITGVLLFLLATTTINAEEIQIAVASNFTNAIQTIASDFEKVSGHKVTLVFGATGKHYAQITNGAPFDAFFAADVKRPALLEKKGFGIKGTRFTYAVGRLALWSTKKNFVDDHGKVLLNGEFKKLAIASPRLAPYGKAAEEVIRSLKLEKHLRKKLVYGENISQTFNFVKSEAALLGFVAFSQIKQPGQPFTGSHWEIPQNLYSPIEQQAILLKDKKGAREFLEYVKSSKAKKIIIGYGYGLPFIGRIPL